MTPQANTTAEMNGGPFSSSGVQAQTRVQAPARSAARRPGLYARYGKRLFDMAMVLMATPIALPLVMILWLLIRRDGGSGFFCQPRVGLNGRIFNCWKLRSMAVDAEDRLRRMCESDPEVAREWHEHQKLANDPRITRIGQFLRKTSLDEIPQLWNIFRGEMSVVGPRPFLPSQQELYVGAGGRAYFDMRPGVTGAWQVEGRSATRFVDRVHFDDSYHDTISLRRDLGLILRTVTVVLRMTGR